VALPLLAPDDLDLMTPAELAEYERLLIAERAELNGDDGPATVGDIDPDNPPANSRELAAALTQGREFQRPHLDLIDRVLSEAAAKGRQRIIVNVGPRYGKTRAVRWACLDLLMRQPDKRIIYGSYGKDLAHEQTRWVRDQIEAHDLGIAVRQDTRRSDRWWIADHDGGMLAAGIGSGITGFGADLFVIDDVIADDKQAQSDTWRKTGWRWYTQTAFDRLEPNATVVIVMTRWHAEDLAGRLLAEQPGVWTHIRIPTVAEADDPLGRLPGELLWPERYDEQAVAEQRTTLTEHGFAARHQQRPSAAEGGLFKRNQFKHWRWADEPSLGRKALLLDGREVYLETLWKFLTVDLAISKKTSADYTAVGVWGITLDGDLLLLDGLRRRIGEDEHFPNVNALRSRWDAGTVWVEKSQHGTTLVYEAGRAGMPIDKLEADADKYTRAIPASTRAKAGRLWLPSVSDAAWVTEWIDELAAFPNAAHDDTTDVVAYAARVAAAHWLPMEPAEVTHARDRAAADPEFVDLMQTAW
jgi:predicted phage terminase large subunit-like protein